MAYTSLEAFDYHLPEELIAQEPIEPRDAARLLVVDRRTGNLDHRVFRDLPGLLSRGDLLVMNDTRVLPARLIGEREGTGGRVEFLLLRQLDAPHWEALVKPGRRLRPGDRVLFGGGRLRATVVRSEPDGKRVVAFASDEPFDQVLEALGRMPLPPYIQTELTQKERYQTVYAKEPGSAAAPTAGLHFTPELLAELERSGIERTAITLHVGLGTFQPVRSGDVTLHQMHAEYYRVSEEAATRIRAVQRAGGKVVAVGTTVARTLETQARQGGIRADSGWTDIFIYPGFSFQAVDALLTNFHLPRSTLLMLVTAFAGYDLAMGAYQVAVAERYRFFSFGDAMLIL